MTARNWSFLGGVVIVAALAGAGGSLAVQRFAAPAPDVRGYLLDHPEVIPEAMQRLQDRETARQDAASGKAVAANRAAIVQPYAGAFAGNPAGDVTLVEYFDYNCGYCRASLPMLHDLVANDPKLKIVFRELPILSPESRTAARASLAAAEQGKFVAFHDALYAAGPLSDARTAAVAAAEGVDLARASRPRAEAEIARNLGMAQQLGLTGTPSWVIGDKVFSGALPLDDMKKAIAAARAKG